MKRSYVVSSNIVSIGYSRRDRILEVEFLWGGIYQYYGVPRSVRDRLAKADSKGQYLNAHIRDHYEYELIHAPTHAS